MKIIVLAFLACIGLSMNVLSAETYAGISLDAVQSRYNGINNASAGLTGLLSASRGEHYAIDLQGGIFGKVGISPHNGEIDLSAVGFLPLGERGINMYGKVGVNDFFTSSSGVKVNKPGLTLGAGLEYRYNKGAVRIGFQHFNVGSNIVSPSLCTNLIGVTFLVK